MSATRFQQQRRVLYYFCAQIATEQNTVMNVPEVAPRGAECGTLPLPA
jgi:hypothetical protein